MGAIVPTLVLLGYNLLAFGSPWDMGYFHHATARFAQVHNAGNPLGLGAPDWSRARDLLWGGHRGLLFYAPIVALAVPGWVVLVSRRLWGMALVSASGVAAVFLVNLSYPEWTGGWSTGPRFLVPLLPFAMLPVAALLAVGGRWATLAAVLLTLAGAVLMLLFQGVGRASPIRSTTRCSTPSSPSGAAIRSPAGPPGDGSPATPSACSSPGSSIASPRGDSGCNSSRSSPSRRSPSRPWSSRCAATP